MATEQTGSTKTFAVLGLVLGVVSLIVMALFFGPAAIVCGTIAGSKGSAMGWIGAVLGFIGLTIWVIFLMLAGASRPAW